MKKKLFIAIIASATIILASCVSVPATEIFTDGTESVFTELSFTDGIDDISTYNNLYPLTGIVTDIEYNVEPEIDLVTITCANGNMFSWYIDSSDCWELNDLASCIMNSNGTKYVYDDEVVLAHYAGGLDQLAEFTCK